MQGGGEVEGDKRKINRQDKAAVVAGDNTDRTDAGAFAIRRAAFTVRRTRPHSLIHGMSHIHAVHVSIRSQRRSVARGRGITGVVVDHAPCAGCLREEQQQQQNNGGHSSQHR